MNLKIEKELVDNCGEGSRSQNPLLNALDLFTNDKSGMRDQKYGQRNRLKHSQRSNENSFSTEEFERYQHDPLSREFERNNLRGFNVNNAPPRYDYGMFQRHSQLNNQRMGNFDTGKWADDYNKMSMNNDVDWIESFEKFQVSERRGDISRYEVQYRKDTKWEDEFLNGEDFKSFDDIYNEKQFTSEFLNQQHEQDEDEDDFIKSFQSYEEHGRKYAEEFLKSQGEMIDETQSNEDDEDYLTDEKLIEIQNRLKNQEYMFSEEVNQFTGGQESFDRGVELFLEGNLSEAILAFESVVKSEPDHSKAWHYLGLVQSENDKDYSACLALEKSLQLDPDNLDSLISLTVGYTNTYDRKKAIDCLMRWIHLKPEYSFVTEGSINLTNDDDENVKIATNIFLKAARSRPNDPDPDVQIALGLLFSIEFHLDKAADCFKAALSKRPSDYALWNKLGATQANNGQYEKAIDAYFRALNIKPSYTRARSNLGISFMHLRDYGEAAKGFLSALTINPNADHIWDNLVVVFKLMNRKDLEDKCKMRDLNVFSDDFNF